MRRQTWASSSISCMHHTRQRSRQERESSWNYEGRNCAEEEEMARQVEIDDSGIHLTWEFPSATGEWGQTDLVNAGQGFCVATYQHLTVQGRQVLLKWFGILDQADELPLERIGSMSQEALAFLRRKQSPGGLGKGGRQQQVAVGPHLGTFLPI